MAPKAHGIRQPFGRQNQVRPGEEPALPSPVSVWAQLALSLSSARTQPPPGSARRAGPSRPKALHPHPAGPALIPPAPPSAPPLGPPARPSALAAELLGSRRSPPPPRVLTLFFPSFPSEDVRLPDQPQPAQGAARLHQGPRVGECSLRRRPLPVRRGSALRGGEDPVVRESPCSKAARGGDGGRRRVSGVGGFPWPPLAAEAWKLARFSSEAPPPSAKEDRTSCCGPSDTEPPEAHAFRGRGWTWVASFAGGGYGLQLKIASVREAEGGPFPDALNGPFNAWPGVDVEVVVSFSNILLGKSAFSPFLPNNH